MEDRKLSRSEITRRQRERAKILKKHAAEAGFQPVQVWMRSEVKSALDQFIDQQAQFDMNDFLDALITLALRDNHGLKVSMPSNEIDPSNDLFRIGAYITNHDGERIGWRRFNDAKLKAEVQICEQQGGASDRGKQLLNLIEQAKRSEG
ncbi:hypothetical protein KUV59_12540 [Marinobacter daepoensis]|uniref:hypothetical protein n=1 Tax=Marinobacter daepoensis TaxID=262077 RepID=UPI001C94C7A1|nr:hypothetical protein [Marinobacter daepoensis]MBY6034004.1 hypothetical protein [Marinobacter daepoensis]